MKSILLITVFYCCFWTSSFAQSTSSDSTAIADSLQIVQDSLSMIKELLAVFDKYDMRTEVDSASYSYAVAGSVNRRMKELDPLMYMKGYMDKYFDTIQVNRAYSRAYSRKLYERYRNRRRPKFNSSIPITNNNPLSDTQLETLKLQYDSTITKGNLFLKNNKKRPEVVTTSSGLQYEIKINGSGGRPKLEDKVEIYYVCTNIEDKELISVQKVDNFNLQNGIKAWQEVLPLMKVGATYKVFVPYNLGYGSQGSQPIQPFETLIYTIELVSIQE